MADAENNDLAPGWAKMQDQHGDYFINLHTKRTSRIRPVQASAFLGTLPPPPPAPDDDEDDEYEVAADNGIEDNAPHSQQQAMQQQMWNQQLYQQQWQRYYAQQQWQQQQQQQQQQWAAHQYPQQHVQQNQMGQYQMPSQSGQYPQQTAPNRPQNIGNAEQESSPSTINDAESVSDSDQPDDDEKLQVQQPKLKEVPPINNDKQSEPNFYRFQPIVPPQMNVAQSSDSVRTASISHKVDISPISQNNPPPLSNPSKIQLAANVDFTANLPPSVEPPAEGTDAVDLCYGHDSHDDVAAPAPMINKQQSTIFGVMLQQTDKNKHLRLEENWEMLIDGIEQNCRVSDQYDVFRAMRKVSKNLLIDDEKYRTLYADNDMVQKKILGRVGGFEFLRGIGFTEGADANELICYKPDQSIVNLAIKSLQKRINALRQRKHEWDPKYRRGGGLQTNVAKKQPKQAVVGGQGQDEEERQLQEALRLSQQQHVQDMLVRQQRELDFAKKRGIKKSVNIYKPKEEEDQKAAFE